MVSKISVKHEIYMTLTKNNFIKMNKGIIERQLNNGYFLAVRSLPIAIERKINFSVRSQIGYK